VNPAWPEGYASPGDPYRVEFKGPWQETGDDTYRGDIPEPDITALEDAFAEAYVDAEVNVSEQQVPWHYTFEMTDWKWRNYCLAHRQCQVNGAHYWSVYILGTYEIFKDDEDARDNDPNDELGRVGVTSNPPGALAVSSVFEETFDDLRRDWSWSTAEYDHAKAGVVLHELALHWKGSEQGDPGMDEATSGPWDHVMRIPAADAEEDNLKDRVNMFNDDAIHAIRRHTHPD